MGILDLNEPEQTVFVSPAKIAAIQMCCEKKKTQKAEVEVKKEWKKEIKVTTKNKKV